VNSSSCFLRNAKNQLEAKVLGVSGLLSWVMLAGKAWDVPKCHWQPGIYTSSIDPAHCTSVHDTVLRSMPVASPSLALVERFLIPDFWYGICKRVKK